MTSSPFRQVLVANRGEIAVRIMKTLRHMGIRSIAVYSDADVDSLHVQVADKALRLGPALAAQSYLSIERLVAAIRSSGADAVHPGYGFLSENATFAEAVIGAGAVWVGPPPAAIEAMGDKVRAKSRVAAAGVPVVPGSSGRGLDDAALTAAALEVGYPVLLKPSAGGGGKGMHLVADPDELPDALAAARREATASFGDDTLLLERFVGSPRHIEVQVFLDSRGNAVHLGERECSLQRRHQKIVEEAPSPLLDQATRDRIGASAVAAARSCGYEGAGTVEFIVSAAQPGEFFFMEMNTRLQVEHPVTEMVTGLDLVELQLRVAAGESLPLSQDEVVLTGHAIEARIYAEDPARGFLPTGGEVLLLAEPAGEHVRIDSGIAVGSRVGTDYDPMLAKVVAWGADRSAALQGLESALEQTVVLGLGTNVAFLCELLRHPDVVAGELDTGLVERMGVTVQDVPPDVLVAAAVCRAAQAVRGTSPWQRADGWRVGERAWATWRFELSGVEPLTVLTRRFGTGFEVSDAGGDVMVVHVHTENGRLDIASPSGRRSYRTAAAAGVRWISREGRTWALRELPAHPRAAGSDETAGGGAVRSPMPGVVLSVRASPGDTVRRGQPLIVVEAMKMEHVVVAPADGVLTSVLVSVGTQVQLDERLAVVTATLPSGVAEHTLQA
jgi:acetyl-CoA/propionyl-CoA carboxylase biotin carboxyl carrier protein